MVIKMAEGTVSDLEPNDVKIEDFTGRKNPGGSYKEKTEFPSEWKV